ncbi:HlyD family efflux transporter periplasmic adaptor subunit [uncultured Methylobacterium sp.]|uniref:HlyD family efflux transporter periplasmic adaptor subunit n=1 Tax=uncultured Methylobacterium sp. TaxID=157278 RepID=UPI0035CAD1F4
MKRTIAAILAADVAGYSRLMAEDEEDTLRRLTAAKAVFREQVARFDGRVFNTAGDAILAEFPSAVEALRAGLAIQAGLDDLDRDDPPTRRVRFRMGLTIGDVVEQDGDLLGDAVNVAARLEGLAEPGGLCLSRTVHEAVSGKVAVTYRDIGPQRLKNIPRPVHAYRVVMPRDPAGGAAAPVRRRRVALAGGAAAALILLGFGALWSFAPGSLIRSGEGTDAAGAPERDDLISVAVARAQRACFRDQIRVSGLIVPRTEVEVRPDGEGLRVLRALAGPLEDVRAGQVIAQLVREGDPEQRPIPVRSPVAGLIGQANAVAGRPASAMAPALFRVIDRGAFELEAEVPLQVLDRIRPDQGVSVTPLGGTPLQGRVRLVATGVDPATQLGRVRILLAGGQSLAEGVRQGQFASGIVRVAERCGVAVPHAAVNREADGAVVYRANARRIEGRPVVVGLASDRLVEITDGLEEGDTIVSRAGPFLRDGDLIRPVRAAGTPQ